MSASLNLNDAKAYKSYVEEFSPEILSKMFLEFETANIATLHENLKGKKTLTEMHVSDLIQVWGKSFSPTQDALKFTPRTLETYEVKVDLSIYPQEFHGSYLGELRRAGADPYELPFPGFIIDKISGKMSQEKEFNAWNGKRINSVTPGALLKDVVTGYQNICQDEVTAGNLSPVATGAITNQNAIEKARMVYKALSPVYQRMPLTAFVSPAHMLKLQENYQDKYGKYVGDPGTGFMFGIGLGNGGVSFRSHAGIQGDFMMMTPSSNLHYGYAPEGELLRFEAYKRELAIMSDFWIGYQIGIVHNDLLRVNDQ